jgi:hypothetical protein
MPGKAAIYIADPSLIGSRLFDKIETIRSYEDLNEGDAASGVRFTLDAGQVTMNFMLPEEQVREHLKGFAGFARQVVKGRDQWVYTQTRIHFVRYVLGCVITPDFDEGGTLKNFIFRFTAATNGLLFFADTIFDYDGQALGGLADEN